MSLGITIEIGGDADRMLRKLGAGVINREELHQDIATRGENLVRDYLTGLAQTRHATADKLGATPTGHLERAAESVTSTSDSAGVSITVTSPGITRAFGSITILPGAGKKYLTIPATAEAYGKRAGAFNDLRFVAYKNGVRALVQASQSNVATREKIGGKVFYWLKTSVEQKQDRTLLPSDQLIESSAEEGAIDWLNVLLADA